MFSPYAGIRFVTLNPTFYIVVFAIACTERYYPNCRDALQCVSTLVQVSNRSAEITTKPEPAGRPVHRPIIPISPRSQAPAWERNCYTLHERNN